MNDFDRGGRFQVKSNAAEHVGWLFPKACQSMAFSRWLDSQSAPRPGEPDRRCDTIAELVHKEGLSHPRAVVIELFTSADADAVDRSVEYMARFRQELRHGPHKRDKYPFLTALIIFTGNLAERSWEHSLPDEDDVESTVRPRILELANRDGVAFLDDIEHNRLPRVLLPWAVLMQNGQTEQLARRWVGLCSGLDENQRRNAAALALNFSALTRSRPVWRPFLENFNMNESTVFREVRVELQRENLMEVLRTRLSGDRLEVAIQRLEKQNDLAVLSRWLRLSLAGSVDTFIAELEK